MNKTRAILALAIVSLGLIANIYSEIIEDWLDNNIQTNNNHNDEILIGIQENENWLVIPVTFEGDIFDSDRAEIILDKESLASDYITQISAGLSTLNTTILDDIWISNYNIGFWGEDGDGGRDSGSDGAGVDDLVESAVKDSLSGMDLSPWDFDNNGIVDRLLILHSANPQEIGGGSSSIWSHMSGLDDPIIINEWSINHYTIASTKSGVGTVVHEMLHQMGAYDLYDVHSTLPTSNWNGIGVWGIIASGNWNGNHRIFLNEKNKFNDVATAAFKKPSRVRTVISADFDNDGFDEIFVNNIGEPNKLFKILRDGELKQIQLNNGLEPFGLGTGAAVADIDNDGILELLVSHGESGQQPLSLYKANIDRSFRFVRILPKTAFNAPARGVTVILNTNMRNHAKTIDAGSGYLCQMEPVAHYGLRKDEKVKSVTIKWTDGSSDNFKINQLNKTYVFSKGI